MKDVEFVAGDSSDKTMSGQERGGQLANAGIVVDDEKAGLQIHSGRGQKHSSWVRAKRIRHVASLQHWRIGGDL